MRRVALGIQYDGSPWRGWQTQLGGGTVQDTLEFALKQFAGADIRTVCAGRTDAGVHALEQVVHFDTPLNREMSSWVRGVNAFLPASIAVRWACEVGCRGADLSHADITDADAFHARFSAVSRTYTYVIYNNPVRSPLLAGRAGWVFRPLEVAPMQEAAAFLVGMHDFSSFRAAACQAKSPVKTMHAISIKQHADLLVVTLTANAFLHHMVRNIVGTLILIGIGNHRPEWMSDVLQSRNRNLAAPTFMPDGLYLAHIGYDAKWGLPQMPERHLPWE